VFHWSTEQNSPIRRAGGNSDRVQAAQLGDLLFVSMSGQILALDSRQLRDDDNDSEAMWQAFPGGRFPVIAPRNVRRTAPTLYHTTWSERKRLPAPAGMPVGGIGPVSPNGVVLQEQQQLRLADPISGETLWARTDIPAGCELFGDDEVVLAASIEDGTVYVISMDDGQILDRRPLPSTPWMLTTGRNVCTVTDTQANHVAKTSLRIVDVVSGKELFNADYNSGVRMTTLEPNWVAVASPPDRSQMSQSIALEMMGLPLIGETPPGRFQLIDVATGKIRIDQSLAVPAVLRSVHTFLSGDQLFVGMNADSPTQSSRRVGNDYPLIDGPVYAFDLITGRPCWPGPAIVQRRGIALTQPDDIPLLVFVDRVMKRDAGSGGSQLRLMCIDKRTGATIYRQDELPDTAGGQFRVRVPRGQPRSIALEMSAQTVRLAFSDRPRPPEPPANDLVEAPRKSLGRGLWGVTQRMGDMLQGAMQDPSGKKWRGNRNGDNDDDNDQQQADGDQ
jgi:outer membrane protein assembly factor BamB